MTTSEQLPASAETDFASIDSLIEAFYAIVSGPAGLRPDWDRERSLFLRSAVLVRTTQVDDATPEASVMDLDGFIAGCEPYLLANDFYERETERTVQEVGALAHVLSYYETSHDPAGEKPIAQGVNSLQLYNDGERWWIVSSVWSALSAGDGDRSTGSRTPRGGGR